MAQANVYTTVSAQTWYTDRCRISTGNTAVTYNVNCITGTPTTGNIFNTETSIPPYNMHDVWVGVGNQITISGINFTAQEIGTQTSGKRAVRQV